VGTGRIDAQVAGGIDLVSQSETPTEPTTAKAFLEWEAENRHEGSHAVDSGTLRKFRDVVRRFGKAWSGDSSRRVRGTALAEGCALLLEFQVGDGWYVCLSVQAHHEEGLCTLKGPGPNRPSKAVPAGVRTLYEKLYQEWRSWEESEGFGRRIITIYLHSWPAAQLDRYVKSAVKAVRELSEVPKRVKPARRSAARKTVRSSAPKSTARKKKTVRRAAKKRRKATGRKGVR
jgi:hypothetical protein